MRIDGVLVSALSLDKWCQSWSQQVSRINARPLIMGVVNSTPDSFSDGGHYDTCSKATDKAIKLIEDGADIIDVGGESSRPGAKPVSLEEERQRVIPLIKSLSKQTNTPISIDTYKPEIMKEAIDAGASMINDIKALREPRALDTVAQLGVPVCLMHMQGLPQTMQDNPDYSDTIITEINRFFSQRLSACEKAGIERKNIILDPGFGFGKLPNHNLNLVKLLHCFHEHQLPILLGVSRKSTLGVILDEPVDKRLIAGITLAVVAAQNGLSILRTHDVLETQQAFKVLDALNESSEP